jgi:hypothetical protein
MKYRNSPNTQIQEFLKNIENRNKNNLSPNIYTNADINPTTNSNIPYSESKPIIPKILSSKENPGNKVIPIKENPIKRPKSTFKDIT